MKLITELLLIIVVLILLGLGAGVFISFINEKVGDLFWWSIFTMLIVASIVYLVRVEIKSRKELARKRAQYVVIGKLLFKNFQAEFEVFYKSFLELNNTSFSKNTMPNEVIHDFANKKGLSFMIDWRGEGDEGKIEHFINATIDQKLLWASTKKLRNSNLNKETNDGKFIIQLFKVIDKDLKAVNKKLLFLDLGNDAYNFIITDENTFKEVTKMEDKDFHGSATL